MLRKKKVYFQYYFDEFILGSFLSLVHFWLLYLLFSFFWWIYPICSSLIQFRFSDSFFSSFKHFIFQCLLVRYCCFEIPTGLLSIPTFSSLCFQNLLFNTLSVDIFTSPYRIRDLIKLQFEVHCLAYYNKSSSCRFRQISFQRKHQVFDVSVLYSILHSWQLNCNLVFLQNGPYF